MKIPDKDKEPWSYQKWEDMDLIEATNTERILMLELSSMEHFHKWLYGGTWWDLKDMRAFVKEVARKINETKKLHDKR